MKRRNNMQKGRVSRGLPQPWPDTEEAPIRLGRYGEMITQGFPRSKHVYADEGSYYISTNPTIGTSIAHVVLAAFDDTKPYIYLRNTEQAQNTQAKRIYLDYIKLLCKVVPASAVEWGYAGILDYAVARLTTGASQIIPVNANGDIVVPSVASLYVGANTCIAGTSARKVCRGRWRGVVPTIYDEYVIVFGAAEGGGSFAGAAASGRCVSPAPPVILGPGQNFCLNLFGTSNAATAAEFELEIGHWER
jgi:hypothetical protein